MPRFEPSSGGTVDYAALSTIPGLPLERTGSGAGTTWTAAASPQTVGSGLTLANIQWQEFWADWYSSSDADTTTVTAILDDDSELTTSGYNFNGVFQVADGTPAIASAEVYAAANIRSIGAVSNVGGETIGFRATSMRPNNALSHKSFDVRTHRFRSDDDLMLQVEQTEVLSTKLVKALKFAQTGTFTGSAGCRAILSA